MLLDTSGLLNLADAREPFHADAVEFYGVADYRLTHSYVLAEFVTVAHARGVPRPAALAFHAGLIAAKSVQVVWVDEPLHGAGVALLAARTDKGYSLCDAVSFVLMRKFAVHEALTTDHHFTQEGFTRLLA
jgi:uncharacterized protein